MLKKILTYFRTILKVRSEPKQKYKIEFQFYYNIFTGKQVCGYVVLRNKKNTKCFNNNRTPSAKQIDKKWEHVLTYPSINNVIIKEHGVNFYYFEKINDAKVALNWYINAVEKSFVYTEYSILNDNILGESNIIDFSNYKNKKDMIDNIKL